MDTEKLIMIWNLKNKFDNLQVEMEKYYINEINYPVIRQKKNKMITKLIEDFKRYYFDKGIPVIQQTTKEKLIQLDATFSDDFKISLFYDGEYGVDSFDLTIPSLEDKDKRYYTFQIEESQEYSIDLKCKTFNKNLFSESVLNKLISDMEDDIQNLKEVGENIDHYKFTFKFYRSGIEGEYNSYEEIINIIPEE